MRRISIVLASFLALAGCKGSKGSTGAAGVQGPVGPIGPAGPLTTPPHITDILPHGGGSANNTWTIVGDHFATTDTNDTVWFDDQTATITSATATEIVISAPFSPVIAASIKAVTVEANNQTSNTVPVFTFPNGTQRDSNLTGSIWSRADFVAQIGAKIYVIDNSLGVYAFDTAAKTFSLVALSNEGGLGQINRVFVGPANSLYLGDNSANGTSRLLKQQADGTWRVAALTQGSLVGFAFDAANDLYLVTSNSAKKLLPTGSFDATFGTVTLTAAGGAVYQGNKLFVTDATNGKNSQIDPATGAVSDFTVATTLPGARLLAGDGANLFVTDNNGIDNVDNAAAVTNFTNLPIDDFSATPKAYSTFTGLFRTAAGAFLLVGGNSIGNPDPRVVQLNDAATVYVPAAQVAPAGLHTDVTKLMKQETLVGPQARGDANRYFVWQKADDIGGPPGRYFVNKAGAAVWLVDPGINGAYNTRPDGTTVRKFDAPKATLMSYIIKGILDRKLPWALVLLGVMIALTLELSFVPALAFAVGVYLPLSSSSPIFFGGLVRWLVDRQMRRRPTHAAMTEEQFVEETDKSPGVLLASGYIAGGAIAGILIAFLAGVLDQFDAALTTWSTAHNPFFEGPYSDALSMIPFVALMVFLYGVGREKWLTPKKT